MGLSERKFYRTRIVIEVLSEGAYEPNSLEGIAHDIDEGDCSGMWDVTDRVEVPVKEFVELVAAQACDPEFFGLTEEGEDREI